MEDSIGTFFMGLCIGLAVGFALFVFLTSGAMDVRMEKLKNQGACVDFVDNHELRYSLLPENLREDYVDMIGRCAS